MPRLSFETHGFWLAALRELLSGRRQKSCFGDHTEVEIDGCRSDGPNIAVVKAGDDAQHNDHDMINN